MMTMSRRPRVRARHCSMYARKMGPFIAPSITKGATIPSWRNPATKVIVFQCPCGTDATNRSPRGQRPLSRTMFVLVAVSSINTSRAGSSMPCSRLQRRRARATSARFCSAACRLFFKADIVSIKETLESAPTAGDALFSHGGENLLEGQIRLFGNQSQDPIRVLFQWRNAPAAPFRRRAPCLTPALAPSNYRTNAHLEDLGYLPPRRSAFNRFNRTLTQVRGIRPRHRFIFSSPGESIFPRFAYATAVGNPFDSMPTGNALIREAAVRNRLEGGTRTSRSPSRRPDRKSAKIIKKQ